MDMRICLPGGKRVNAAYKGFTIRTDQPIESDGEGSELLRPLTFS